MVNSRAKGNTGEKKLIQDLYELTGIEFSQTPGSGSGKVKGDLTCPSCKYCIEVKNYKDDPLDSRILANKSSLIPQWWKKLKQQSGKKLPLLIYRWNRSKWFVITSTKPTKTKNYIDFPSQDCYILLLEEWIDKEDIQWLHLKS